jgi:hypothetical protein
MKTPKFAISCKRTRLSALSKRCNDRVDKQAFCPASSRELQKELGRINLACAVRGWHRVIDKQGRLSVQKFDAFPKSAVVPEPDSSKIKKSDHCGVEVDPSEGGNIP